MDNYNYNYNRFIKPLYGEKRNQTTDICLLSDNILPHTYNVTERVDMTEYETYSIDPDGCEDADDAFSIYEKNEKLFLAIHIADPTEYININSSLWKDIENRIVTRYPSNNDPIHMIPDEIMQKSSLMVNTYGNIKLAITILTEINKEDYNPIGKINLLFTKIRVKQENALSYTKAGELYYTNNVLDNGIKISNAMSYNRYGRTKSVILNEVSNSYTKFDDNREPYLYCDTITERLMKQMIAEFAIFANSFVGEYLKIHFNGIGLYRACSAKDWLNTVFNGISGQELLNEIIVNGIKAEYLSTVESHDLVGSPEYCHFTSPIRRLTDCVCHYLLKYIHLKNINNNIIVPFTENQLENYSNDCVKVTKSIKNLQYKDNKFRLIQTINNMLNQNQKINISYYITSYKQPFLNIIICGINLHTVYLSYTLRISNFNTNYTIKDVKIINITHVKCLGKFDEGSIPELDQIYK